MLMLAYDVVYACVTPSDKRSLLFHGQGVFQGVLRILQCVAHVKKRSSREKG